MTQPNHLPPTQARLHADILTALHAIGATVQRLEGRLYIVREGASVEIAHLVRDEVWRLSREEAEAVQG